MYSDHHRNATYNNHTNNSYYLFYILQINAFITDIFNFQEDTKNVKTSFLHIPDTTQSEKKQKCEHQTSGGSRISPGGGGRQHTILPNFPENCMKSKEFGRPGGGGGALLAPLNPKLQTLDLRQTEYSYRHIRNYVWGHYTNRCFSPVIKVKYI